MDLHDVTRTDIVSGVVQSSRICDVQIGFLQGLGALLYIAKEARRAL